MILSGPFLAGLLLLIGIEFVAPPLPAPVDGLRLLGCAALVPLPALLARFTGRRIVAAALSGRPPARIVHLSNAAQRLAVPLIYGVIIVWGRLHDLADLLAAESDGARAAIMIGPLLLLELTVRGVELGTDHWLRLRGFQPASMLIVTRARTSLLFALALVSVGLVFDLVARDRHLEVWLTSTEIGISVCLMLAVLAISVVLPPALVLALRPAVGCRRTGSRRSERCVRSWTSPPARCGCSTPSDARSPPH